jgi:hypothetical protein
MKVSLNSNTSMAIGIAAVLSFATLITVLVHGLPDKQNPLQSCDDCYECTALIRGRVFMKDRVYSADVPGLIENIADAEESFKFSLHYGNILYNYDDIQCQCLEGSSSATFELEKVEAEAKAALRFKAYIEAKERRQNNKQHSQNVYNPYQNGKRIAE